MHEKVNVQGSLHHPRDPHNVLPVVVFGKEAVDPVQNVQAYHQFGKKSVMHEAQLKATTRKQQVQLWQAAEAARQCGLRYVKADVASSRHVLRRPQHTSVAAECEHVIRSHVFDQARALEHHELGEDGHSLQVDGERPQNFLDDRPREVQLPLVVEHQRQDKAGHDEEEMREIVLLLCLGFVRRGIRLDKTHQSHDADRAYEVHNLEDRVVHGVKVEQVKVAADEHQGVQLLRHQRNSRCGLLLVHGVHKDHEAEQVAEVSRKAEKVQHRWHARWFTEINLSFVCRTQAEEV